jgi:AraC-like DNA-binding protein
VSLQINQVQIEELMKSFYMLSGIKFVLFDTDFKEIISYPKGNCDFCAIMKSHPKTRRKCNYADRCSFKKCEKQNSLIIYKCHAGLVETVMPLHQNENVIGYLMFGQILYNTNETKQYDEIKNLTKDYFKDDEFDDLIKSVRTLSNEYLSSVENIMTACISYIHINQILTATKTGLWAQIDYYIERNTAKNFSLEEMADDLGVSVSSICKTAKNHSNKTVLQLLTEKRLKKAKNLLKSTDMNINEIAYTVGIQDYNYFTKLFKKHEELTPSQYRKNYRKIQN